MPEKPLIGNRELSWLKFNARVIAEARNASNPPLERAKFLAIASMNLDEFFMVRVGKLERKADAGSAKRDPSGMTVTEQLEEIRKTVRRQVKDLHEAYDEELLPLLRGEGILLLGPDQLNGDQRLWLSSFFDARIMPVLTPRAINPSHPFPLLSARRLYLGTLLQSEKGGSPQMSIVPVPGVLDRVVFLPMGEGKARGLLLEDVVTLFLGRLFPHMESLCSLPFRITRNADFAVMADRTETIVDEMSKNIGKRSYGKIVRLEAPEKSNRQLLRRITDALEVKSSLLQECRGPMDLGFLLRQIHALTGFDALKYAPFEPRVDQRLAQRESVFRTLRGGDLFFYHPYDSFEPVLRFVREAAEDPHVLAIKQTLYRISNRSPLIPLLAAAAQNGKQVTVLIEVRARFDEESNINWSKSLEKAGCHVLYGVPKWKTHSKITLVVRRETDGLRRYVHIGTGNYNDSTARNYTDMGIMTCDREIGEDAGAFFNIITGYSHTFPMSQLIASPYTMRNRFLGMIRREQDNAMAGLPAGITVKVNSLSDPQIISALYAAAGAGVAVKLLVRGICCIRPDDAGRIVVQSIVGRFLEHTRAFVFRNAGSQEVYLSSADWMPRNLDKRIELATPVKDPQIASRIAQTLDLELSDSQKAWRLNAQGDYVRRKPGAEAVNSQEVLLSSGGRPVDRRSAPPL